MCKYCENSSEFELDSDRDLFEGRGLTTKLFIDNEGEDYYLQLVNDLTGEKIKTTKIQVCPVCYHVLGTSYVPENVTKYVSSSVIFPIVLRRAQLKKHGKTFLSLKAGVVYNLIIRIIRIPVIYLRQLLDLLHQIIKNEEPLLGYSRNSALVDMINATYSGLGEIDREVLQ